MIKGAAHGWKDLSDCEATAGTEAPIWAQKLQVDAWSIVCLGLCGLCRAICDQKQEREASHQKWRCLAALVVG